MASSDLSFGKIASNPTKSAWSQAYNAGGLFVILSLSLVDPEKEHESLGIIGKNFLNDLEAEFFSLEEKNTDGIGAVLEKVVTEVPTSVNLGTVVAYHKDATLYLFLIGNGSIVIKRGSDLGTILSQTQSENRNIKSASGFLTPQDTLLLASSAFKKSVSDEAIRKALSLEDINEAIEMLAPHIHQTEDSSATALIFRHKSDDSEAVGLSQEAEEPIESPTEPQSVPNIKTPEDEAHPIESPVLSHPGELESYPPSPAPEKKPRSFTLPISLASLSHRRKVILSVAAILIVILGLSVFFTISTQQAAERQELFNSVYPEALESYEEAEGLMELNPVLAKEELEKAKELLAQTEGKFPENSEEYKQTKELEDKVNNLLAKSGEAETVEAKEISDSESLILASLKSQDAVAAVEDSESVYYLTDEGIKSVRKASKSEQTLVENDSTWGNAVGLGKFGSNFYVLDTKEGVIKLVPSGTEYNDSKYLVEDVSVSDSTSMALDTSVYILYKNGDVKKFTRGNEDDFSISGLERKLNSPTQITTTEDFDNLYILDPATARIVKIKKDGSFVNEYQTSVLQDAKAIAVSEDESKAYILSDALLYEISL